MYPDSNHVFDGGGCNDDFPCVEYSTDIAKPIECTICGAQFHGKLGQYDLNVSDLHTLCTHVVIQVYSVVEIPRACIYLIMQTELYKRQAPGPCKFTYNLFLQDDNLDVIAQCMCVKNRAVGVKRLTVKQNGLTFGTPRP